MKLRELLKRLLTRILEWLRKPAPPPDPENESVLWALHEEENEGLFVAITLDDEEEEFDH